MDAQQVEQVVRLTIDFCEDEQIARHDLAVKASNEEIARFAQWVADQEPGAYRRDWDESR